MEGLGEGGFTRISFCLARFMSLILRGFIRHVGYASLVLVAVCLFMESVMPAFVTPYFNPYALAVFGLVMSVFGLQGIFGSRFARWVLGGVFVVGIGLAIWFYLGDVSALLVGVGLAGLVAFFVTSVYAFEV